MKQTILILMSVMVVASTEDKGKWIEKEENDNLEYAIAK